MLFLGHIGLSLAAAKGVDRVLKLGSNDNRVAKFIDYRVVMIGAILPDLIDKPLVNYLYNLENHSGHFIAHSKYFALAIIVLGLFFSLYRADTKILVLGISNMFHIFFDVMILKPNDKIYYVFSKLFFLVPKNFDFAGRFTNQFFERYPYLKSVESYLLQPYIYIFELIGLIVIIWFGYKLVIRKKLVKFIKVGEL